MFPYWRGAGARFKAGLHEIAGDTVFRLGVAAFLACLHLAVFAYVGDDVLGRPFNAAPGEQPYYANPDAPAVRGFPRQPLHWSRLINSRWDSQIYIGFAERGLSSCPTEVDDTIPPERMDIRYLDCGLGWFPAWGLIGGQVSLVTGVASDVTLVIMSVLAAIILNFLWTSRAIQDRLGRFEAYMTLLAFNMFPTAFYLVTPYTEAATFALVIGAFLLMMRDKWLLAAVLVGASTGLRASALSFAFAFGCAALTCAWQRRKTQDSTWWKPLAVTPLAAWAFFAQMIVFHFMVGDPNAYIRARRAFGDERDFSRLLDPDFYLRGFTSQHMDMVVLFGCLFVILLCGREALKRFRRDQAVFLIVASFVGLVMALVSLHEYWGLNRYMLLMPITFPCLGIMARKHTLMFVCWLVFSAVFYWKVEMCSYIAHGNPAVCPCLGRLEFMFPVDS